MELKNYLDLVWRRKWVILTTTVLTVLVTTVGTIMVPPRYRASATLRVATTGMGSPDQARYDLMYADRLMNTYSRIATSAPVRAELGQRLGSNELPQITVNIVANTELMQIIAEGTDPMLVRDAANTVAAIVSAQKQEEATADVKTAREFLGEQLAQAEEELDQARKQYESLLLQPDENSQLVGAISRSVELKERTYGTLLERYEQARVTEAMRANAVSVLEPAVAPRAPFAPNKQLNIGVGLFSGLVAGIGLAFLFENLDTTLHTMKQITDSTQLFPLGMIPRATRRSRKLIFNSNSPQEEAFRHLRTNLSILNYDGPLQTLLIASAEPGEGKSTIAANLACSLAKSGRKVVVVDADLRLPTLHTIFNLPNELGLSNVLEHNVPVNNVVQQTAIPGVKVLTSGPFVSNPTELLGSSQMASLLEGLAQQFEMVLLDSPALLPVVDAAVLARMVDGVMLVVKRAQTRQESILTARQQLTNVKARVIGIVVNQAEQSSHYHADHRPPLQHA